MAEQWSTETRDLVATTIAAHRQDIKGRSGEGNWGTIGCACGHHVIDVKSASDVLRGMREHDEHVADVVLTALTEVAAGPRVWAMPPPILPTVNAVTDKHGRTFHRVDGSPFWRRLDAEQRYEWPEGDLIQAFGPLTEVLPNGD